MIRSMLRRTAVATEYSNARYIFSLRKVHSYNGFCIEVERSSDNTKQNIGFSGDFLDTAALLSFVGAGDGTVTTLYNQGTESVNLTATTNNKIVIGGVLQTLNGKAAIVISGGLSLSFNIGGSEPYIDFGYTEVFVARVTTTAFSIGSAGGTGYFHLSETKRFRHNGTIIGFTVTTDRVNQTISGSCWDLASQNIRLDYMGSDIGLLNGLNNSWSSGISYGRSNMVLQEHVIWGYNANDISTTKLGELCDLSNQYWNSY